MRHPPTTTYSMRQSPILQLQDLKNEIIVWITIYLAVNFFINKNANSDKLCSYTFMGICPIQMYILIQYACQTKLWSTCDCPTKNKFCLALFIPTLHRRGYTVLPLSIPRYFSLHFSEQLLMAEIWYLVISFILWKAFLDPSDSYFLFADLIGFYTHWTYMHIFRHIFLSNYWWQRSDIWSQASYRYPILWEAFLNPSDSYFLFADFVDFYTH
jgi:hypothetical protein